MSLAPWFYRNLIEPNEIINPPEYFRVQNIYEGEVFEAVCSLKPDLKPSWVSVSSIYRNCEGAGTSKHLNIAIYKAISEALERWAFYHTATESLFLKFGFNEDPSTTGMAAYPGFLTSIARKNARFEAIERWAVHNFWKGLLPIKEHETLDLISIYEIITPFPDVHVVVLNMVSDGLNIFSFACENSFQATVRHALVELNRNRRVLNQRNEFQLDKLEDISDKRLLFFSRPEGKALYLEKVQKAPCAINAVPKLICDSEIKGPWTKYAKVWRVLYAESYPKDFEDHTFFMF